MHCVLVGDEHRRTQLLERDICQIQSTFLPRGIFFLIVFCEPQPTEFPVTP
eukprot:SAG31_NODE_17940_length_652_cov_1.113924_2_plen_50_part_01